MTSLHEPYPRPWGYRRELGRTDRSGIVIPAARERIYAALPDPSALETWLPPANMRGRVLEFDARPGGVLRMELTYVDGSPGKSSEHSDVTEVTFGDLTRGPCERARRVTRQPRELLGDTPSRRVGPAFPAHMPRR